MTYCLGMLLDSGLILMADTRTNAGVDNFSTFRKLHMLSDEPDRQIFGATDGSLSVIPRDKMGSGSALDAVKGA